MSNNPYDIFVDKIFKAIGFYLPDGKVNKIDEERADIGFCRFRKADIMEKCKIVKITSRIGGGNRLEFKENIRDIKDHSLYLTSMESPIDNTYVWWYFRVPENNIPKMVDVVKQYKKYKVMDLNKEYPSENELWNLLYNKDFKTMDESDTDYSDQENFTEKYGYWHGDEMSEEDIDDMSDNEKRNDSDYVCFDMKFMHL
jgi:hypothetical protein